MGSCPVQNKREDFQQLDILLHSHFIEMYNYAGRTLQTKICSVFVSGLFLTIECIANAVSLAAAYEKALVVFCRRLTMTSLKASTVALQDVSPSVRRPSARFGTITRNALFWR